ncbi:MAG: GH92 family glycosyl hydrolase [Oscillospiraceae bacterium]|nr:GH92 family glycosyl hydrolase [Oscillospiraceae bacterium]
MRYAEYVNIKQGTFSERRFSNGNTLPLVQLPFAMAGYAPQTEDEGGWFFHPAARSLEGVRLTHQPSPWISDYGTFLFTPQTGIVRNTPDKAWSGYRPEEAVLTPSYMKLRFLRARTDLELTPGVRSFKLRMTYPQNRTPFLSLFSVFGNYTFAIDREHNRVLATTDGARGDFHVGFKTYLVLQFNTPIDIERSVIDETFAHIAFCGTNVEADGATSYISFEQAVENCRQDCDGLSFDAMREKGEAIWEEYLSRIEIEANDDKQMRTFYSCMYRTGLFPHKAYEIKDGKAVHYCPFDGSVRDGVRYTDNGFWDTYRTEYPLLALIGKKEYAEILEGFITDYIDGGWLPRWPSIGERGCMPSTLLDAVIADAAVKGIIGGSLLETAFEGMLHHANHDAPNNDLGRQGASAYIRYGYVPKDIVEKSNVNLTLDAAYGDFCIAQVARVLGKEDIAHEYDKRAQNYRNLFDPQTGFMRGKTTNGTFVEPFDCFDWGGDYTEGSAWQSSFAVPHDIEGLADLYGGKEKLIRKLDELFATPPLYNVDGYNYEIHEMTEMAAVDFGQCAISNQPSFHLPYLFAALGCPEKTQYWVSKLCAEAFSDADDGFPGDEDNGSMAAWYILSTLGIYDICPGKNEYIRIPKLCKRAKLLGQEI